MGILLCEIFFGTFGFEMKVRAEIGQILRTHTHTHTHTHAHTHTHTHTRGSISSKDDSTGKPSAKDGRPQKSSATQILNTAVFDFIIS